MNEEPSATSLWDDLLIAFLLKPPEGILLTSEEREARVARYIRLVLPCVDVEHKLRNVAEVIDRGLGAETLTLPWLASMSSSLVQVRAGALLTAFHPVSALRRDLDACAVPEEAVCGALHALSSTVADARARFLAVWRALPGRLAENRPWLRAAPADARIPDHTVWHTADIRTGFYAAQRNGSPALFSFQLGPVQPFIAAARSVLDLWSGSAILSWLTFQAMLPVIEELGPTAVVFPSLRGSPLLDLWLRDSNGLSSIVQKPSEDARKTPCIPNRFLAIVPWGEKGSHAEKLRRKCEEWVRTRWQGAADAVRQRLADRWGAWLGWDRRWEEQVKSFFEVRTAVLPVDKAPVEAMETLLGQGYLGEASDAAKSPGSAGRWQALVELSGRLMAAQRTVAHFPKSTKPGSTGEDFPAKCSLMGSFEQVGPSNFAESTRFWDEAAHRDKGVKIGPVRLRKRERFCAIALSKRFAVPVFLAEGLGLDPGRPWFRDTATIAAARWLENAEIDPEQEWRQSGAWNGQWLHWQSEDSDSDEERVPSTLWERIKKAKENHGSPPIYYAILVMDADRMGEWLQGKKAPKVGNVLHPALSEDLRTRNATTGLDAGRPVTPEVHAAISEALVNFAVFVAPAVVREHQGTIVYSGGDDVLALLPARNALACARELYLAFRGEEKVNHGACRGYYRADGGDLLMMGPSATLSAGLAVVHYKDDLRLSLAAARDAERAAKNAGRDALTLAICRRSGEHSSALATWHLVPQIDGWISAFEQGASDRWAYHLFAEREALSGLPLDAVRAEIKRQVERAERPTSDLLRGTEGRTAGEVIADEFSKYVDARQQRESPESRAKPVGRFLPDFLTLCQAASFIARGRGI